MTNDIVASSEFPQLSDIAYFDYAGCGQYTLSQLEAITEALKDQLLSNPHSGSCGLLDFKGRERQSSETMVQNTRNKVLEFAGASLDEYTMVFTRNSTHAIQIFASYFPVSFGLSHIFVLEDNHTSIQGIKQLFTSKNCTVHNYQDIDSILLKCSELSDGQSLVNVNHLVFIPAQSNFNGKIYPWKDICKELQKISAYGNQKFHLFCDTASYCANSNFEIQGPDFAVSGICMSFAKIFGLPSHLGALIVHNDMISQFREPDSIYLFGGGTVEAMTLDWHVLKGFSDGADGGAESRKTAHYERLEDGSLPLTDILSLSVSFCKHEDEFGPWIALRNRLHSWTHWLISWMASQVHYDKSPVFKLHIEDDILGDIMDNCSHNSSPKSLDDLKLTLDMWTHQSQDKSFGRQGPIIAFSVLKPKQASDQFVYPSHVFTLASLEGIVLRVGMMCNVGCSMKCLDIDPSAVKQGHKMGWKCGKPQNKSFKKNAILCENHAELRKLEGCLRISMGRGTTAKDLWSWIKFTERHLIQKHSPSYINKEYDLLASFNINSLSIYPIKSCHAATITHDKADKRDQHRGKLEIDCVSGSFKFDREWMLVNNQNGRTISQKQYPRMALIRPAINLKTGLLTVEAPGMSKISIELNSNITEGHKNPIASLKKRDNERSKDAWFSEFLGIDCKLVRSDRSSNFSNESGFLLVNRASMNYINNIIQQSRESLDKSEWDEGNVNISCFRGNIVIDAVSIKECNELEFIEDKWTRIRIGSQIFDVCGKCKRCNMICIDQETGERHKEPFISLAKYRKFDGQLYFGVHLKHRPDLSTKPYVLAIGDAVTELGDKSYCPR